MFSKEERIAIVSLKLRGLTYVQVQERFQARFQKAAPTRTNIRLLLNKFLRTGSILDERRSGRPTTPEATVQQLREAVERSPRASTRRLSRESEVAHTTVWRVLRYRLKKRAYQVQVVQKLEAQDYAAREAMCDDLLLQVEGENLMDHMLFSDEAIFHTCGHVNRHNSRIWADEQPHATQEWERNTPKINVWLGLTKNKVYGPFMFMENTITGTTYLDMLQQFLQPQLEDDGILGSVVFQQDGAPPHFARIVRDYLHEVFPGRWIGRGSVRMWAPRSPDLTPLDFFAWGFIKAEVYRVKIQSIEHLRQRIFTAVARITPAMLERVFRATVERWGLCLDMQGEHVELY
ncbi:hypothetical protein L9F63_001115 [Diploptera punctata]|uniref:DUF4817 domain-containing protein n=1 Tax=Diploptera punctata TaxID=6984 RepID=A0AAD8EJC9_DIPPU|nr:hypothetical protein L9F63_001115 [Diploptera punctata]